GLAHRAPVVAVQTVEQVALVEPPRDHAGAWLDAEPRIALVHVARMEPGERGHDPALAAPLFVELVEPQRLADRAAEAVEARHVARLAELAHDAREDRAFGMEENELPRIEDGRRLGVLTAEVGILVAELREEPVPVRGADLLELQAFSRARARSMFIASSTGCSPLRPSSLNVRQRIFRSSLRDQW